MKDHICLEPISKEKRRQLAESRSQTRNVVAIWALILSGCTMTIVAFAVAMKLYLPF